jgi:hypothetical protein
MIFKLTCEGHQAFIVADTPADASERAADWLVDSDWHVPVTPEEKVRLVPIVMEDTAGRKYEVTVTVEPALPDGEECDA